MSVVIVSDGSQSIQSALISAEQLAALRVMETRAAMRVLGVDEADLTFLGFPDAGLHGHRDAIATALQSHIAALGPAEICAPYGIDGHRDHRTVADVMDGLVRTGAVTCAVYDYPVWFWPRGALRHVAAPARLRRLRRVATSGWLPQKRQAMDAYKSQREHITGEAHTWVLEDSFLANFYKPYEFFFLR